MKRSFRVAEWIESKLENMEWEEREKKNKKKIEIINEVK